jgi:prepilin-type N-terminal cleavage/methylation domain-containing protein
MSPVGPKRNRAAQQGFTLIELLIGMALLGLILLVVNSLFTSSANGTSQLNARNDLQQETLNAQNLIGARLKEAWYVYPEGTDLNFPTDSRIVDPTGGAANVYRVGTDPVLALILPPLASGGAYRLFAYYAVRRATWLSATTGFNNPGGSATDGTWVLAEYRANFAAKPTIGATPPPLPTTAPSMNLLAEDIVPTNVAGGTYSLFTFGTSNVTNPTAQEATWPVPYVNRVALNVRVRQTRGGQTVVLPSASTQFTLNIFPENIGRSGMQ